MGSHLLLNVKEVDALLADDMDGCRFRIDNVLDECAVPVLGSIAHKFEPQGLSIVYLLAASHFSIHTYPELGVLHIDLFHCGDIARVHNTLHLARRLLQEAFPGTHCYQIVDRP